MKLFPTIQQDLKLASVGFLGYSHGNPPNAQLFCDSNITSAFIQSLFQTIFLVLKDNVLENIVVLVSEKRSYFLSIRPCFVLLSAICNCSGLFQCKLFSPHPRLRYTIRLCPTSLSGCFKSLGKL